MTDQQQYEGFARITRIVLVVLAIVGTTFFGLGVAATYTMRPQIELAAEEYLETEVVRRAKSKLEGVEGLSRDSAATTLMNDLSKRMARVDWFMESQLPELVGRALAELCDIECEEAKEWRSRETATMLRGVARVQRSGLNAQNRALVEFVQGLYRERLYDLVRELRLFTSVNAVLFAVCLGLLALKRRNMRLAVLPVGLMVLATTGAAILYVAGQDWFWTVLMGDFVGATYAVVGFQEHRTPVFHEDSPPGSWLRVSLGS